MPDKLHAVSVSGGKDSTATYLWAIDNLDDFIAVFADTGNEHPVTVNYVKNLHHMTGGPEVHIVQADFTEQLHKKGITPSGDTWLDMFYYKNNYFPRPLRRFCTTELKMKPIRMFLYEIANDREIHSYVGIRREESERRRKLPETEYDSFFDAYIHRPIIDWTTEQVFQYLETKGVDPNPLYTKGSTRVGCYPCIMSNKRELAQLENWAWDKVEQWEAKTNYSFFKYPAQQISEWAKTSRGGKQYQLDWDKHEDVNACMSSWVVCE